MTQGTLAGIPESCHVHSSTNQLVMASITSNHLNDETNVCFVLQAEAAVAELADAERGSGSLYVKFMTKAVAKVWFRQQYSALRIVLCAVRASAHGDICQPPTVNNGPKLDQLSVEQGRVIAIIDFRLDSTPLS